jgi:hypothetical protein
MALAAGTSWWYDMVGLALVSGSCLQEPFKTVDGRGDGPKVGDHPRGFTTEIRMIRLILRIRRR